MATAIAAYVYTLLLIFCVETLTSREPTWSRAARDGLAVVAFIVICSVLLVPVIGGYVLIFSLSN